MTQLKKTVHNLETGKITQEDFTDEEIAIYEQDMAAEAARIATKASLLAKLAALGLSADEIAAF